MSHAISRWNDDRSLLQDLWESKCFYVPRWLNTSVSLVCMTAWIGIVAAYDVYLTILYALTLESLEVNPVARGIMHLDTPTQEFLTSLALFIGLKCAGIVVVMSVVFMISIWRKHWALLIAGGVSTFQLALLMFLCFAQF